MASPLDVERTVEVPVHPLRFEQVRIENTAHCGYRCFFCPREKLTRPLGFMPLEDLLLVLNRVGTHRGRVDLHGFGEPLLDAELPLKVAAVLQRWPDAVPTIYSTLGATVPRSRIHDLVRAGIAHIEVSFYGTESRSYAEAHGVDRFEVARRNLELLTRARAEIGSKLRIVVRDFPSHEEIKQPGTSGDAVRALHEWMLSIGVDAVRQRALHNFGAGRDYNAPGAKKPCSVIWGLRYRILQVTWDLDVIPCCFDFDSSIRLGNLRRQTLEDIFASEAYRRFYRAHALNRLADYPTCASCERCLEP